MFSVEHKSSHSAMLYSEKSSHPRHKQHRGHLSGSTGPSKVSPWYHLWKYSLFVLSSAGLACLVSGIFYLQNQMTNSRLLAIQKFDWLVLVQGDQLTIDEIGRYLKQIDGAEEVSYLSPQAVLERMKGEGVSEQDVALLEKGSLSPAWKINWSKKSFLTNKNISDTLTDIRNFPGVMDVAYNPQILQNINEYQFRYLQSRLVLSLFVFFLVSVSALIVGRILFFMNISMEATKAGLYAFISDSAGWGLGYGICLYLLGPIPFRVLWAGFIFAALHSITTVFNHPSSS